MKSNELRIGNYVDYFEDGNHSIIRVLDWDYCHLNDASSIDYLAIKPIPLTEEWLLKFGSYSLNSLEENNNKFWITEHILYKIDEKKLYLFGEDSQIYSQCFIIDCEYVHTLQNLYFALTNKELTI